MSVWWRNSGAESAIGKPGYCIRRRDVFVSSDAYAAEQPLSFS